jgi:hypothetical protein
MGASFDPGVLLTPDDDRRTPAVIVSVARLDDEERALVLGPVREELLSWVRSLHATQNPAPCSCSTRYPLPPENPPTKGRLVSLMKQVGEDRAKFHPTVRRLAPRWLG